MVIDLDEVEASHSKEREEPRMFEDYIEAAIKKL